MAGGCQSVHGEKGGREDSAPKTVVVAMPTLLVWRKAASGCTIMRGASGVAGVPGTRLLEVGRVTSEQGEQALDGAVSRRGGMHIFVGKQWLDRLNYNSSKDVHTSSSRRPSSVRKTVDLPGGHKGAVELLRW